jgi:hypothetical protein
VFQYALLELLARKELDQLGEDGAPSVHPALSIARQQIPPSTLLTTIVFAIDQTAQPIKATFFSPGGQKGFLRRGRTCMNRMPKKFASLPVSPVYLLRGSL